MSIWQVGRDTGGDFAGVEAVITAVPDAGVPVPLR
jgi:hypothetical protein